MIFSLPLQFSSVSITDLQNYRQHLLRQTAQAQGGDVGNNKDSVKFNKKLLDFDYGSDEDDDKQNSPHLQNQALQQQNLTDVSFTFKKKL